MLIILLLNIAVIDISYINNKEVKMDNNPTNSNLTISTTAFSDNEEIPTQYTCKGSNINPPINISGIPQDAISFALVMHDPDAVNGDFVHWLMWDIPAIDQSISPDNVPIGAMQGLNDAGSKKYYGPCPPSGTGTHHYIFELYALDKMLNLNAESNRDELLEQINGHVIAQAKLTGLFSSD
jgi:Raf kinase inhibitor-like YbhB/YbcL family protein